MAGLTSKKPNFDLLWRSFPKGKSAPEIYRLIGGKLWGNHQSDPTKYANACALRMSYALNRAGYIIPYQAGIVMGSAYYDMSKRPGEQTPVQETERAKHPEHFKKRWHFYRVVDVVRYIRNTYGSPDINSTGTGNKAPFLQKKGIIFFKVADWSDAQGHVTLFNGTQCIDNDDEFSHIDSSNEFVSLWQLH